MVESSRLSTYVQHDMYVLQAYPQPLGFLISAFDIMVFPSEEEANL